MALSAPSAIAFQSNYIHAKGIKNKALLDQKVRLSRFSAPKIKPALKKVNVCYIRPLPTAGRK